MAAGAGRVSFLDNHDMNRFLFVAGNHPELLKLAALCQFTLQPVPAIYYGTEVGMSQRMDPVGIYGGDAEIRRDMSWNREDWDLDLLSFYQALVRMRTSLPVLAEGERRVVHLDASQQTYAYLRTLQNPQTSRKIMKLQPPPRREHTHETQNGQEVLHWGDVLVMFNLSAETRTLAVSLLSENAVAVVHTGIEPAIRMTHDQVEIALAPFSGAVFEQRG
jgi:cyclomaltodextrinase / maltogenic alpha-amylase / neopullulanase